MVTTKSISQALHLHFNLSYDQIAELIGSDRTKVRGHVVNGLAWQSRPAAERTEAIAAARALIEEGGR